MLTKLINRMGLPFSIRMKGPASQRARKNDPTRIEPIRV